MSLTQYRARSPFPKTPVYCGTVYITVARTAMILLIPVATAPDKLSTITLSLMSHLLHRGAHAQINSNHLHHLTDEAYGVLCTVLLTVHRISYA